MIRLYRPTFIDALHTDRPAADRADKMGLYGWLIGRWRWTPSPMPMTARKHSGRGEIHFGWVLEGRAIQDVWILARAVDAYGTLCGSTIPASTPGTSCGSTR